MTDTSTPHNDCDFSVDLGTTFTARRMVLGAVAIENYFINLNDLSLTLNGVDYTIIPQVYLTQGTLIQYLKNQTGNNSWVYGNTLPVYD